VPSVLRYGRAAAGRPCLNVPVPLSPEQLVRSPRRSRQIGWGGGGGGGVACVAVPPLKFPLPPALATERAEGFGLPERRLTGLLKWPPCSGRARPPEANPPRLMVKRSTSPGEYKFTTTIDPARPCCVEGHRARPPGSIRRRGRDTPKGTPHLAGSRPDPAATFLQADSPSTLLASMR